MRATAAFLIVILAGSASAHPSRKAEDVKDVFRWISDHVQPVSYTVTTPMATYQEDDMAKVEFTGCSARITDELKTPKSNIRTTTLFDLRDIQADMIRSSSQQGVGDTHASEYFMVQLTLANPAKNTTTFRTPGGSKTDTSSTNFVSIVLPDRDMADRQVSAWRDASRTCGARD
jgi:hypothetical protein